MPLYCQLIADLKKVCREFPPGTRLPAELEICQALGCSRNIVRQALQSLTTDGLLERRRPAGTFISSGNRKKRILVVHSKRENACDFLVEVIAGIEKAAAEFNVELVKVNFEFLRSGTIPERRKSIMEMELDGILLVSSFYWGMEPELEMLDGLGIPVLMPFGNPCDSEITPFKVMFHDVRLAVCSAIRLLHQWGHHNIAGISYEETGIHGLTPAEFSAFAFYDRKHTHMVRQTGTTDKEIDAMVDWFLALPEPPTVFLCHSDYYAVRILEHLRERRIRVPEDISVMAVFAHQGSELLSPPLTTISMELARRGEAALRYIVNEDPSAPLPVIPPRLIFRESVQILK